MAEQLELLPGYLMAHLELSLVALLIGTSISVPLGIWITRRKSVAQGILGLVGVIQTIPSLALLALMVPALALLSGFTASELGFEIRSIGYLPAVVALTLYSILPVLQTTVAGIDGIDPSLIEAARGVGMTDRQRLRRVELPLALPVIVAGLRTATVWVVGTATLSTPVGAASLGNYIFSGLQTRNFTAVLVGCAAAAALALVLDQTIRLLESGVRLRRRPFILTSVTVLAALYALTAGSLLQGAISTSRPSIAIGSKTFTEQYILSELLVGWVENKTGLEARTVQSLGSTVLFDALLSGDIDIYVDYSGTIWATVMKGEGRPGAREDVLEEVRNYLADEHGIVLAAALGFENTYALAMRSDDAKRRGIETLSDLAPAAKQMEIGGDYEFFVRAEWKALVDTYSFEFAKNRSMDSSLMYQAVAESEVDVISAFSTDGRIAAFNLSVLRDDQAVIPPYDAIVLIGPHAAREHPELTTALARLEGTIDADAMRQLNLSVDGDGRTPTDVGRELLGRLASP
ncbi:MAG: ABC transporter permease subunit [bacterium]|nr:ABC transporter permease subunit [bacterium]